MDSYDPDKLKELGAILKWIAQFTLFVTGLLVLQYYITGGIDFSDFTSTLVVGVIVYFALKQKGSTDAKGEK